MTAIITEIRYRNGPESDPDDDFVEVRVPSGADVSSIVVEIYNQNGTLRSSNPLSGGTMSSFGSFDYYVIFSRINRFGAVALIESGNVNAFYSFDTTVSATEGAASGLTSTSVGSNGSDSGSSLVSEDGIGFTENENPDPTTPPCFVEGTKIMTKNGRISVDKLRIGDLVLTADSGYLPILAIRRWRVSPEKIHKNNKLRPICFAQNSLGYGIPEAPLCVSRQHRMLLSSPIIERKIGHPEAWVPAAHLMNWPGVFLGEETSSVTYIHLLLERHHVIYAEGAPTETLLMAKVTREGLSDGHMRSLEMGGAELSGIELPCRPILKGKVLRDVLRRHSKNRKPLVARETAILSSAA